MRGRKASLLLMLVSVLVSVLVVDLGLRLVLGPVRVVEDFYEPHPHVGYRMRPDLEFVFANPRHGYNAMVHTNAQGLRDDPIVLPKPDGTFRILLLGDSMTAGLEVDKQHTFEAVLEEALQDVGPVDVVNAGVRGYNLDNIQAYLETEGVQLEPDLVLYLFVDNDLTDDATPQPRQTDASRGFTWGGWWGRIANHSHLAHRLSLLVQTMQMRRQADSDEPTDGKVSVSNGLFVLFGYAEYDASPFHRTGSRIARLHETAARSGASFLLVGAPHREEIDPLSQDWWRRYLQKPNRPLNFDGVRAYLAWVGEQYDVERFDVVPAFRAAWSAETPLWFHKDHHLNVDGHRLLARQLEDRVRRHVAFQAWQRGEPLPAVPAPSAADGDRADGSGAGQGIGAAAPRLISFPTPDEGFVFADEYGTGEHAVVLAHGGRFTKESWRDQAPRIAAAGFRVLAIDFRGRGRSVGGPATPDNDAGFHFDVLAAVEYLRENGATTVSVVGASFGGWATGEAMVASPGSIDRAVFLANGVDEPEKLTGRTLFILARDDVRGEDTPRLPGIREDFEQAPEPKEMVLLDGKAHAQFLFDTDQGERLLSEILRFLAAP